MAWESNQSSATNFWYSSKVSYFALLTFRVLMVLIKFFYGCCCCPLLYFTKCYTKNLWGSFWHWYLIWNVNFQGILFLSVQEMLWNLCISIGHLTLIRLPLSLFQIWKKKRYIVALGNMIIVSFMSRVLQLWIIIHK